MRRKLTIISLPVALAGLASCLALWLIGGSLAAPQNQHIGELPSNLTGRNVEFKSVSGSLLRGWFIPGKNGMGTVILMHGVRANRLSMLNRARFLASAGYSVLLFDFQAHGESPGEHVTFGYLESKDAQAAVAFLHQNNLRGKIGIIGVSMGGAASLLATPPLEVDALILESVYPTIEVGPEELRPIEKARESHTPKFFIFGSEDRHTRVAESKRLFADAADPKEAWEIEGAGHVDLHEYSKAEYERRILAFLERYLR
jgi:uncharacterized protein